jgi:hypothetical protein
MPVSTDPEGNLTNTTPDLSGIFGAILGKEVNQTTNSQQNTQNTTAQNSATASNQATQAATTGSQTTSQSQTGQTTGTNTTTGNTQQSTTGTVGHTNDTTQQSQQTQTATANIDPLLETYNKQAAGITPEMLAAIFQQGSKAAPQLLTANSNALGARVGNNSPLAAALNELQTNLVAKAADINRQMLQDSGQTAANIAANTKSVTSTGSNTSSSTGQDIQDLLTATDSTQIAQQLQQTLNQTQGQTDTSQNTQSQTIGANTTATSGTQTQNQQAAEVKKTASTINTGVAKTLVGAFVGGVALNELFKAATGKGFTGNLVDFAKSLLGAGGKLTDINAQLAAAGFPPISDQDALTYLNQTPPENLPPYNYEAPPTPDAPIPDVPSFDEDPWANIDSTGGFAEGGMPSRDAPFLPVDPLIKHPAAIANDDSGLNLGSAGTAGLLAALLGHTTQGVGGQAAPGTNSPSPAISTGSPPGDSGPGAPSSGGVVGGPAGLAGAISGLSGIMGAVLGVPGFAVSAIHGIVSAVSNASAPGGISGISGASAALGANATSDNPGVTPGTSIGDAVGEAPGDSGDGDGDGGDGGDGGGGDGGAYADGGMIVEPKVGTRSPLPQGEGAGGLSRSAVSSRTGALPLPAQPASNPLRFEKGTIPRVEKGVADALGGYADGGMVTNMDGDPASIATDATLMGDDNHHVALMGALGITRTPQGIHLDRNAMNLLAAHLPSQGNSSPSQPEGYKKGGMPSYSGGGKIVGPGTGTSDSIPAVTSGKRQIKISNGEYIIPAEVVTHFGADAFDELLNQFK